MDVIVETEEAKWALINALGAQPVPFTVTLIEGRHRTTAQNKLQHRWIKEVSQQTGHEPEEVRGYCKLVIGIPILREASTGFRQKYDELLKGLSYQNKLRLMMVPFDLAVTRLMTVDQKREYLTRLHDHFTQQGYILTAPED